MGSPARRLTNPITRCWDQPHYGYAGTDSDEAPTESLTRTPYADERMRPGLVDWPALRPGARVAVVSPSAAAPAHFPAVHEGGLQRLRGLGVEPVEYPTARRAAG